jgi:hypothetical protein
MSPELTFQARRLLADGHSPRVVTQKIRAGASLADFEKLLTEVAALADEVDLFLEAPVTEKRRLVTAKLLAIADTCALTDPKHELKALEQLVELNGLQVEPGTVGESKDLTLNEVDRRLAELIKANPDLAKKLHQDA